MNITEKIIARASNRNSVNPGDVVFANVDKLMIHDVSGPGVIKVFEEWSKKGIHLDRVWNADKIWITEDHFVPSADRISAENISRLTKWAEKFGIKKHFKYGLGQYGICHTLSHEEALVLPGEFYVGGDSHTNTTGALGALAVGLGHTDVAYAMMHGRIWLKVPETLLFKIIGKKPPHIMAKDIILKIISDIGTDGANYMTMEFAGNVVSQMSMEERLTLTNMTTEAGAKNGIIEPDAVTDEYIQQRTADTYKSVLGDDPHYLEEYTYEIEKLEPFVAKPYSPQNGAAARELQTVEINKAYIGSCTGAKLEDLRSAAQILKGKKVKVRTEVLPAAQSIYIKAMKEGLIEIFMEAGAVVGPPTCGACCGAHMGILAKDEICVSTTNRNFPGRMGHVESQTYLASPLVVAASAIKGKITDPRDVSN
ncbi:MAG: 3-isopropylmalate dehydratase large subunit [Nitrososphaeraceae archaeon]|jgi:3-isopropylmalate/(R)-2-methylmalate dehydratase large subunit|nr:3-isopropylmalate dehydratase large subunit [Nitrososphaeraceae archaeon]MDW0168586.1 3-isopropylmalate dehydratase large subunit [Nitrososphaeraceae archaeon]MDW0171284.1 3-isopropylmalate dehydratase large subunit [Nitrososphaeraceae archaeon]MDW0173646.1 3-isopropylmalate dehydratase large subunit [Nitrososphaeraceae archaeon]MDW0176227.1 3-isopropylmalate dehydratase large subunit [Nitrososphaeraceae archaeon]